eukprot:4590752-Ditylum_brightwellii.AAC.1
MACLPSHPSQWHHASAFSHLHSESPEVGQNEHMHEMSLFDFQTVRQCEDQAKNSRNLEEEKDGQSL